MQNNIRPRSIAKKQSNLLIGIWNNLPVVLNKKENCSPPFLDTFSVSLISASMYCLLLTTLKQYRELRSEHPAFIIVIAFYAAAR